MWWRRKDSKAIEEAARKVRGSLAAEIVRNDRTRAHLLAQGNSVGALLEDLFKQLDEAKRRG